MSSCVAGEFAWYVFFWNLLALWVKLGFSVGMEAFDEVLSINVLWSQEFSDVLRIWSKSPASGFQFYFYSSLKISPSTQHQ